MATTRTPRKTAVKRTTATRTTAGTRTTRTRRAPVPMTKEVRAAAASALADFEEQLLEHPNIGLTSSATRELKSGAIQKVVRFENGDVKHRAVLVVRYR